jgi:hypothetical protein
MKAVWQKDKQIIDSSVDKRYTIKEEISSPHSVSSYLEIENVGRYDSALFTCIVSNNFGSDDTNIQLIVQGIDRVKYES